MSTDLITIDAAKAGGQLSEAVSRARSLVERAADGIARDLVQVQAAIIIRQAMTPEIEALIVAAGKSVHYEVVNYGDNRVKLESQIDVCLQAVTMGLRLAGQQFSVWGDWKGDAKLYVKSAGYRQLLRNTGRATDIRANVGFPEFVVQGKSKKDHDQGVAYMSGEASCVWDGAYMVVMAPEQYKIGIPWTRTDNVDGVIAKGERRMLARLWAACSGSEESDEHTELADVVSVVSVESGAGYVTEAPPSGRDWAAEKERYVTEYKAIKDEPLKTLYLSMMRAADQNAVSAVMEAAATAQMDARDRGRLELARDWQMERIAAGAM